MVQPNLPQERDARAHAASVREQFAVQATTFANTGFATRGLDWIVDHLAPATHELVLDVAAGAAHVGRALVPHAAHVSAVDITPEMLYQGNALAMADGITNVTFQLADAAALPWIDEQFDLVVCRLALHQVYDPRAVVHEMLRVTRPSRRVGIVDLVADEDPGLAGEMNRLERLRDPSHGRALSEGEIRGLIEETGSTVTSVVDQDQPLDLEDWMARTSTPEVARAEIRARFNEELSGGTPTGLRPFRDANGTVGFVHRWIMFVAIPRQ